MQTAIEYFLNGDRWSDSTGRQTLSILIALAKIGQTCTYGELARLLFRLYGVDLIPITVTYRTALEKAGLSVNRLSSDWREEIPPPTILVVNKTTGRPSAGVDLFLARYVAENERMHLSDENRSAMIDRATDAVHSYSRWNDVADYFGISVPTLPLDSDPILLSPPIEHMGGEGDDHRLLKEHLARQPELFSKFGDFSAGEVEVLLDSGDRLDILFRNEDSELAIEVKTATAPLGELTRGIYQCVKYRAVLRAKNTVAGKLVHVQVLLATPQALRYHSTSSRG